MKRFTDCNKWDDPWYCELSPENRSLYEYILDRSDQVGMWKVNKRMAEFCIHSTIDLNKFLKIAGDRIHVYSDELWWIVGYCKFQYGELKESCKPHLKYLKMLSDYGLSKGYPKGINTLQEEDKDKKEEEDKEINIVISGDTSSNWQKFFGEFEVKARFKEVDRMMIANLLKKIPTERREDFLSRCDQIQHDIVKDGKSRYGAENLVKEAMQTIDQKQKSKEPQFSAMQELIMESKKC